MAETIPPSDPVPPADPAPPAAPPADPPIIPPGQLPPLDEIVDPKACFGPTGGRQRPDPFGCTP